MMNKKGMGVGIWILIILILMAVIVVAYFLLGGDGSGISSTLSGSNIPQPPALPS